MIVLPTLAASDVVAMLRRHYLPEGRAAGGIFAAEIESPDGRRRADAIWAPWSMTAGDELVGHEVKVARSDVLAELADPMKADPWLGYCSRWYLVLARPALVDGLDVPESWGIMAPPSGRRTRSMTVIRPAPKLKHGDTASGWRRIATWDHNRQAARLVELERLRWSGGPFDEADVIAALVDVGAYRSLARRARDEIEYVISEARRVAAPMADVARELEKLTKRDAPSVQESR